MPRVNKKILGKFKDECPNSPLVKFIGTKAKSYCIVSEEEEVKKKIKGIRRHVVQNDIAVKDFVKCARDPQSAMHSRMTVIRSDKHFIYTQQINKISLSGNDDKRFLVPNLFPIHWHGETAI